MEFSWKLHGQNNIHKLTVNGNLRGKKDCEEKFPQPLGVRFECVCVLQEKKALETCFIPLYREERKEPFTSLVHARIQ